MNDQPSTLSSLEYNSRDHGRGHGGKDREISNHGIGRGQSTNKR